MISFRLGFVLGCLLPAFGAGNMAAAHDFASGPRMGLPPKPKNPVVSSGDLVPADLDPATLSRVRGVLDRVKLWPQDTTLIVCYLSGTQVARVRVTEIALEWTKYINIRLDFGDQNNPRMCGGANSEHIKIDFVATGADAGHWSYLGIDSKRFPHSMNMADYGRDALPIAEDEYRGVVLHEFGHALGLEHEHQNPEARCDVEFDTVKVKQWADSISWSEQEVQTNLLRLLPSFTRVTTRHDPKSIMHYSLPEALFRGGKTNKCWVEKNHELSEGDQIFAAQMYPQRVAALAPGTGATRSAKAAPSPQSVETAYRAELQKAFETALASSGVTGTKAAKMSSDFKRDLARARTATPAPAGPNP